MSGGHGHVGLIEQENCPAGRRPGRPAGDLGDVGQECADPWPLLSHRRVQSLVFLPGQRYESEPDTNEDRKELLARAKAKQTFRDHSLPAYHMFEYASACFQLAIVLAGAAALTAVAWLTIVSFGLGGGRHRLHDFGLCGAQPAPHLETTKNTRWPGHRVFSKLLFGPATSRAGLPAV